VSFEQAAQRTSGYAIASPAGVVLGWIGIAISALFLVLGFLVFLAFV
jgi:hypothetical protein